MKHFLLSLLLAAPALGQDIGTDITFETYAINSDTLSEVAAEIGAEGPQGLPGYTVWDVRWSADCEVRVAATVTLPELAPDADLAPHARAEFERMLAALKDHELGHVAIAQGFAREVAEAGCQGDTDAIHQDWLAAERAYDAETNHGQTQGAWLNLD